MSASAKANRQYKDTVFRDIFGKEERKEYTLSLYNALNGTSYADPALLELNTLNNVIYMGMKNDVSFLIGDELNLWEHQSTHNPNMPLRVLKYVAKMYEKFVDKNDEDEYSSSPIRLPTPKAVVFYIGEQEHKDVEIMRLSDLYVGKGDLEVTVKSYNINYGHNRELMEKCEALMGYSRLVAGVRRGLGQGLSLTDAVNSALDECIANGIFAAYFIERRAEVADIFMFDYDEEKVRERMRRSSYRRGREEGRKTGRAEGREEALAEAIRALTGDGRPEDEAMDMLHVPASERPRYRELLAQA